MFGDATTLPFPDDSFDLVLAIEVLEHVPTPDHALSELSRVCSGTFVASVPFEPIWRAGNIVRRRYVKALGNTPGHVNHWTRWGFRKFVGTRFHVQQVAQPAPLDDDASHPPLKHSFWSGSWSHGATKIRTETAVSGASRRRAGGR